MFLAPVSCTRCIGMIFWAVCHWLKDKEEKEEGSCAATDRDERDGDCVRTAELIKVLCC